MFSIYREAPGKRRGYPFETFARDFLSICESHRREGRALSFAFILYDFGNAELVKVLQDDVYWRALDVISGHTLTIFSFHTEDPQPNYGHEVKSMYAIEQAPQQQLQKVLSFYFGSNHRFRMPYVLFFQADGERILSYCAVELSAQRIEDSYSELRDVIGDVVQVLSSVTPEINESDEAVFNLIQAHLVKRKIVARVKKGAQTINTAKGVLPLLKSLLSIM